MTGFRKTADDNCRVRRGEITLKQRVGLRIRNLRKTAGLTQDQLAGLIGMSVQMVQQVERGVTAPSFCTLEALSDALQAPPAMMFPATVSAKQSVAEDNVVSAIMAGAVRLTKEDAEILLALAAHLNERKR